MSNAMSAMSREEREELRGINAQGKKPLVLLLFCKTKNMGQPWADAGFEVWCVDIQHQPGVNRDGNFVFVGADMRDWVPPKDINDLVRFVAAFPPCDDLANSGNRWKAAKGLSKLRDAIGLFDRAVFWCEWFGVPYMIENPVSSISTYWRKPDHTFHPWHFSGLFAGDTYNKKTCLWVGGGFAMPAPCHPDDVVPDDRIWRAAPGDGRADFRSETPRGFAIAVFRANRR